MLVKGGPGHLWRIFSDFGGLYIIERIYKPVQVANIKFPMVYLIFALLALKPCVHGYLEAVNTVPMPTYR